MSGGGYQWSMWLEFGQSITCLLKSGSPLAPGGRIGQSSAFHGVEISVSI